MTLFDINNNILQWLSENNVDDETIDDARSQLFMCVYESIYDYINILRRNSDE